MHHNCYLPCRASNHHLSCVFAQSDLLDTQPGIITIRVKAANLDGHSGLSPKRYKKKQSQILHIETRRSDSTINN